MFEAKTAAASRVTPDAAPQQGGDGAGGWFGLDLLAELQIINLKTIHWLRALARQDEAATPHAAAARGQSLAVAGAG